MTTISTFIYCIGFIIMALVSIAFVCIIGRAIILDILKIIDDIKDRQEEYKKFNESGKWKEK